MADTKNKSNFFPSLEKLNKQAEFVNTNEHNSILDIDALLDCLRQMYTECMEMREKMENEKNSVSAKNQYPTLSLFNDGDFEESAPASKDHSASAPRPVSAPSPKEREQSVSPAPARKKHVDPPKTDNNINKTIAVNAIADTAAEQAAEAVKTQDKPKSAPVSQVQPADTSAGNTPATPEKDEDILPDADDILDLEKIVSPAETPSAQANEAASFNDIDLDEIEFDEYEEDEDAPLPHTETAATPQPASSAMPPSYWGDEIDTENPITSKKTMSLGETYKQERPSINDMLANYKKNNIIGQKIPASTNLISSMDMNDKFTFTRELFHNDNALFRESIERLDSIKSLKDVLLCLDNMKKQHHWNDNNASVIRLQELIYAKFGQN